MKKNLLLIIFSLISLKVFCQEQLAHEDTIRIIQFSDDNNYIITAGDDRMIRLWDVNKGSMIKAIKHGYTVQNVFLDPSNKNLFTSNGADYNCLWDIENGKALKCFSDKDLEFKGFTSDGKNILAITYGNDGKKFASIVLISIHNYERRSIQQKFYLDSTIGKINFSNDKNTILIFSDKNILAFDHINEGVKLKFNLKNHTDLIAISSNQKFFIEKGSRNILHLKDFQVAKELEEPLKTGNKIKIWFANDDQNIVSIDSEKEVKIFETRNGKVDQKFTPVYYGFNISSNLKYLVYTEDGKKLAIKNVQSGELIHQFVADDISEEQGYINYLKALKYYREQKFSLSAEHFTKSLGKISDDRIYLFRGRAYLHHGAYEKAIDDFLMDEQIQRGRSSLDLSKAYAAKGNAEKTIYYLNENLQSNYKARWSSFINDKYFSYLKNNPAWQSYINEHPTSEPEKMAIQAEKKMKENKFIEALTLINSSLESESNNPDWYQLRAKIEMELEQYDYAVLDLRKVLTLDKLRFNEVYRNIAIVYTRKGDLEKASVLLNEIVKEDSSQFYLLLDIAEIELSRYNTEEALSAVDTYLSLINDDDDAYYIRANITEGEEAKRDIHKAISLCKTQNKNVPKKYYELLKILK